VQVEKATMTDGLFPEPVRVRHKERGGRWGHASPFMRGSTIVRSQTFSPGARSQYVCRLYRSDSDSSTLPKKSPFVRNTLERRTLRYKQVRSSPAAQVCLASVSEGFARVQQSYRCSLAEQPTRTSLDLELDLQACRTRQRQLMEELSTLRELKLRLEEPQAREGPEPPHWALRDERFRCLLREAQRQVSVPAVGRRRAWACSTKRAASTGQPEQAGAAAGGGGREEAEEGLQGGPADEGAEPEGASAGADLQVRETPQRAGAGPEPRGVG
ncbi:unnamed protein product, partial [Tetraodon nigroviridis]